MEENFGSKKTLVITSVFIALYSTIEVKASFCGMSIFK